MPFSDFGDDLTIEFLREGRVDVVCPETCLNMTDRNAIIIGASRGLGLALVDRICMEG
jgi:hypothetical protein